MKKRTEFLENLTPGEMERFLMGMDPADHRIDPESAARIRNKFIADIGGNPSQVNPRASERLSDPNEGTIHSGSGRRFPYRRLAAAVLVAAGLSLLNPTVQAGLRQLVSLIPGIGAVDTVNGNQMMMSSDISILEGKDQVAGRPILFATEEQVVLVIQINESNPKEENPAGLDRFRAVLNGTVVSGRPSGTASGSETQSVYQVSYEASPDAGDVLRFTSEELGITVEGTLQPLDRVDPADLPHGEIADVLVMADPVRSDQGWEIYVYALSETVRPISFQESYSFVTPLYFETLSGGKYTLEAPSSYGTGFMPPLILDAPAGKGDLVIPGITYTTDDQAEYTFRIPDEEEILEPGDGFELGGIRVSVKKIYHSPENPGQIRMEVSWPAGQLTLDQFMVDDFSSMSLTQGGAVLDLEVGYSFTGKETMTVRRPEFTWHEELRIPLELK